MTCDAQFLLETLRRDGNFSTLVDGDSLLVEGRLEDPVLVLAHNVGMHKPSQEEALAKVAVIRNWFAGVLEGSPEFSRWCGPRLVEVELYVFSGPMDFVLARSHGNLVEWLVELDPAS